ncbi:ankyrin repeat and SAM domain-containing protein 4B [Protopterus annectens]|uniref:ankyrin repeat and SAM domain-containing protein 4B n=1 Tax=Protopterus annectens TaxID=7888 RepID=UPI001CFB9DEB|nr:ankyrin repeat and SAM domain-containing protein 4B [Protopterus annectens]
MSTRYHKSAIDGYLELLKEATKKDLNTADEDGMTPTLLASYHGQLEALELCCSRGGDPDKHDIWGNTALHHAAANGHIHCITFLVNVGANIFALDNDFHSPLDVASAKGQMECITLLDKAASSQNIKNPKKVARQKEQAEKDAIRHVKECERVKKRHESKMSKKQVSQETKSYSNIPTISSVQDVSDISTYSSRTFPSSVSGSIAGRLKGTLQKKLGKKDMSSVSNQAGNDVFFVQEENGSAGRMNVSNVFNEKDELALEGGSPPSEESVFKRPGLGNMVFKRHLALEINPEHEESLSSNGYHDIGSRIPSELLQLEGGESKGDLEGEDSDLPWKEDEIGLEDEEHETTPLEAFLASLSLLDMIPQLRKEEIDLSTLLLCSDEDLRNIYIQLGPRKKILDATEKRKKVLKSPGKISDTSL